MGMIKNRMMDDAENNIFTALDQRTGYEKRLIYERKFSGWYCPNCEIALSVMGQTQDQCPHCGYPLTWAQGK